MLPLILALPALAASPIDLADSTALTLTLPAGNVTVVAGEALSVTLTEKTWSEQCRVVSDVDGAAAVEVVSRRKATCTADATVTVPRGARLRLSVGAGDIALQETDASIDVLVEDGSVSLSQTGGSVFAQIGTGGLTGSAAGGLLANLDTGSVSVSWDRLPSGDIHVQTRDGDVSLTLPADVSLTSTDRQPASFRAVMPGEKTVQADARKGEVVVLKG